MRHIHDLNYWAAVAEGPDPSTGSTSALRAAYAAVALGSAYLQCKSAGYADKAIADECVKMADAMLAALEAKKVGTE